MYHDILKCGELMGGGSSWRYMGVRMGFKLTLFL
jgi:hypothetical protein